MKRTTEPVSNSPEDPTEGRPALTPGRVIGAAVALADSIGVDALTIRKLAAELDVKPMTIYHHVPNKEAIIDGMVDRVFAEIERPPTDLDWQAALRHGAIPPEPLCSAIHGRPR